MNQAEKPTTIVISLPLDAAVTRDVELVSVAVPRGAARRLAEVLEKTAEEGEEHYAMLGDIASRGGYTPFELSRKREEVRGHIFWLRQIADAARQAVGDAPAE